MVTPISTGNISQVRVALTGFPGGPGVSTFYWGSEVAPNLTALKTFFTVMAGVLPTSCLITFPSSGDVIDSATGTLNDVWTATAPAPISGTGTGTTMTAQGIQTKWVTDVVADGRALRGRTFWVPCASGVFGADGLVTPANTATFTAAAHALAIAAPGHLSIWHRPKKGPKPAPGVPAPILREGGIATVTDGSVPRIAVVLTSRRD